MAHLHRVVFAVLVALLGVGAHALVPKVTGTEYQSSAGINLPWFSDVLQACQSGLPKMQQNNPGGTNWTITYDTQSCIYRYKDSMGSQTYVTALYVTRTGSFCPANSVLSGASCQCNAGYVEDPTHTSCVLPPDPCLDVKGAIYGEIEWANATKGNNYGCVGGEGMLASCQTVAVCDYATKASGQAGYTCRGIAYANGVRSTMCTGTGESSDSPSKPPVTDPVNPDKPPVPGQPAPARCPAGQAPGEFNGSRICAPTGSGSETSTPAPGNGSSTVNNSDGSSMTSTQTGRTTCVQGQCTTTTNTTNVTTNAPGNNTCPSGQTSGTTTVGGQSRTTCTGTGSGSSTQAQSGFCEKNPKDKQCDGDGADTSFGGTCAGGFKAVSDDAVINAMAEETFRQNCKVNPDDESQVLGRTEAAKTGNQTGDNPNNSAVSIGAGSFDNSNALGGVASCIADKSVVVMGKSINIAFSMICQYLEALGLVMVGVASLLAARIVTRG